MIVFESASVAVLANTSMRDDGAPLTILRPVSLTLSEHRVAVIGANGSGKSTLARLINGLVTPSTGRVLVNGLDTVKHGTKVRSQVGFLFADADAQIVMPTPLEDVALSLRRLGLTRSERDDRAHEVLVRFGLGWLATAPVQALSGGQKQLLAIASVLAVEPQILVCDEPTTRLDLRWRHYVDELLAALPQQLIHVTHDLDAAALTERCLVIADGSVLADGQGDWAVEQYREHAASLPTIDLTQTSVQ